MPSPSVVSKKRNEGQHRPRRHKFPRGGQKRSTVPPGVIEGAAAKNQIAIIRWNQKAVSNGMLYAPKLSNMLKEAQGRSKWDF